MKELTSSELVSINGGNVSPDPAVAHGYSVGYRIGRAFANTINMFKSIF